MKVGLVLIALAAAVVANVDDNEIDLVREDGSIGVESNFIISWEVRHQLRKLQKQMPCGWPEHGIPPLAPYRREEVHLNLRTEILETINDILQFRLTGLDDFKIKKLKLNVIFKTVKFHFIFHKISIGGKYNTDTILDMLETLGLKVRLETGGKLGLDLEKISISGRIKYKLPLFGSLRITKLDASVTLGDVNANITGLLGDGKYNKLMNDMIEKVILGGVNENTELISKKIEANLVPRVNVMLKGNKLWDIIKLITSGGGSSTVCVPPEDPWAD